MENVELKQRFLTRRWNNLIVVLLGIPAAAFITLAYLNGTSDGLAGLIGMGIIGVFY